MSEPQHLRVIGARSIFQFFLPPGGSLFRSCDFLLVEPRKARESLRNLPDNDGLTIVVNPDDYPIDALASLRGVVWLWFLRPIHRERSPHSSVAPRLTRSSEESSMTRKSFLDSLEAKPSVSIVVSDAESFEYCNRRGIRVRLSPPPVTDGVADLASSSEATISVWTPEKSTEYVRKFVEALPPEVLATELPRVVDPALIKVPTHWVVPQEDFMRAFPYEAAMALVAGQTLISEALVPRWGLEPGLDYIEYSTPEELFRIVEHIARYPHSTQLMSSRGKSKSRTFVASQVYVQLLSEPRGS